MFAKKAYIIWAIWAFNLVMNRSVMTGLQAIRAGFFLTPAAEKTNTKAENSSQKLKEKTQSQGGTFYILQKTQEKNSILSIFV